MVPHVPLTRRMFLVATLGSSAGVLAACQRPGRYVGGPQDQVPPLPTTPVRIGFLTPSGSWDEALEQALPRWQAQYPTIEVQWSTGAWPFIDAVVTRAAGGVLEDVVYYWFGEQAPQIWFASGLLVAVDSFVKAHRLNPRDWYKAQWDMMFLDGKQFGVPVAGQVHGIALYYNKNIFDEKGMKYPDPTWTLNDLVEAAEKLKLVEGGEVKRWGADAVTQLYHEIMSAYARNFNAEMFSPDQKRFTWGEGPEFLRFLQWYTDVMQKRVGVVYSKGADRSGQGTGGYVGMLQGRVAMIFKGWLGATGGMAGFLRDNPGVRYGVTFTPKGPTGRRGGFVTSGGLFLTQFSKHADAAFRFMLFLADREFGVALGLQRRGSTTIHPRPDVYHDERLQQDPYIPKEVAQFKAQSLDWANREEDCSYLRAVPWNLRITEIFEAQKATTHKIWTGEAPGNQEMVNELRRLVEPIMQKGRPLVSTSGL